MNDCRELETVLGIARRIWWAMQGAQSAQDLRADVRASLEALYERLGGWASNETRKEAQDWALQNLPAEAWFNESARERICAALEHAVSTHGAHALRAFMYVHESAYVDDILCLCAILDWCAAEWLHAVEEGAVNDDDTADFGNDF